MKSRPKGITAQITQLAWTVTLGTLAIFVIFIIPAQKRDLQVSLESKAHGVAAALQGEVATAAISEDYSSVVEHAMQVVAGDPAVEFVVISKNDGYAVVVDRQGWRVVPTIDPSWHPTTRVTSSRIGYVPTFGERVLHYSSPFDYSGLEWGWIHVGLSLDSYDASVQSVYRRTGILAVLCIALSLCASLLYARRFVQPVLRLQEVVEKLGQGDLSARAEIHSSNEIERLGEAFNGMAEAVRDRDRIVESVGFAARALQSATEWERVMDAVLAKIGDATQVCCVFVIEHCKKNNARFSHRVRFEWKRSGTPPDPPTWLQNDSEDARIEDQVRRLSKGELLIDTHATENTSKDTYPQVQAIIAAPILAGQFWGALWLLDHARDREWRDAERDAVAAVADMLGTSITRQQTQSALVEAKSQLEQRVEERTLELREQIVAKDKAHAELEEAQKRLIDLSRQSGMAEVATGVLHNVGNVLNSINVASNILMDRLGTSRVHQLQDLSQMLAEHQESIGEFLTKDARGQRILPYLHKLSAHILEEQQGMAKELDGLVHHVSHVKEIVAMQQTYARTSGLLEKVPAKAILNDALSITRAGLDRHGVIVREEIDAEPILVTDRHKVLQILLNLLRNAKDAVKVGRETQRGITIGLSCPTPDRVQFRVSDNGIGIAPENLTRIFSHGFTTKRNGHGFGLHSGALAANQLGGTLRVESEGTGHGATFRLELPVQRVNEDLSRNN